MSRFQGLDAKRIAQKPEKVALAAEAAEPEAEAPLRRSVKAKAREGKKPIIGYFSEDLSRELRMMSVSEGSTMQALLGEAIDLLMTARGKNRFGER